MAYADAIPMDLLKAEQQRISRERVDAERDATEARNAGEGIMETYRRAQAFMQRGAEAYRLGGPNVRRLLTQAFLARIEVDTDDEQASLAGPWREIQNAAPLARAPAPQRRIIEMRSTTTTNPDHFGGQGSNKDPLVELVRLYSNPKTEAECLRLVRYAASSPRPAGGSKRHRSQRQHRLSTSEIAELIKEYEQQATVKS